MAVYSGRGRKEPSAAAGRVRRWTTGRDGAAVVRKPRQRAGLHHRCAHRREAVRRDLRGAGAGAGVRPSHLTLSGGPRTTTVVVRGPPPSVKCRVAPGDCSPGAPTDPDVPNSGIRLLRNADSPRDGPRNQRGEIAITHGVMMTRHDAAGGAERRPTPDRPACRPARRSGRAMRERGPNRARRGARACRTSRGSPGVRCRCHPRAREESGGARRRPGRRLDDGCLGLHPRLAGQSRKRCQSLRSLSRSRSLS